MDLKIFFLLSAIIAISVWISVDIITDLLSNIFYDRLNSISLLLPENPFDESRQFALSMLPVALSLASIAGSIIYVRLR